MPCDNARVSPLLSEITVDNCFRRETGSNAKTDRFAGPRAYCTQRLVIQCDCIKSECPQPACRFLPAWRKYAFNNTGIVVSFKASIGRILINLECRPFQKKRNSTAVCQANANRKVLQHQVEAKSGSIVSRCDEARKVDTCAVARTMPCLEPLYQMVEWKARRKHRMPRVPPSKACWQRAPTY